MDLCCYIRYPLYQSLSISEKVKRLEALLTKCKDSIKTNKHKNSALAETNRSLSEQMTEREAESERLRIQVQLGGNGTNSLIPGSPGLS